MYAEETHGILVVAEPQYLEGESRPEESLFGFSYKITLAKRGTESVQLVSRHWVITDGKGTVREVKGEGVVGQQPVLKPGESFQYSSFSTLPTPTGNMRGSYDFKNTKDGSMLRVRIPLFFLRDFSEMIH
jgi:ApaG protein